MANMDQERINELEKIVSEHEEKLSWKYGGDLLQKTNHVLSQYRQIADNAIQQAKNFLEDTKTQFKALEIIIEGLTDEGLNHGQKRTIANHIIRMLRRGVDRLDEVEYKYETNMLDRYNFYRSKTPEGRLYEERAMLRQDLDRHKALISDLKKKHPEVFEQMEDDIPF